MARDLKTILVTTAALLALGAVVFGAWLALSGEAGESGGFVYGVLVFAANAALPCLLIVAAYHTAFRLLSKRAGRPSQAVRFVLVIGAIALVAGGMFVVDLALSEGRAPARLFANDYRGWLMWAVALSPALLLIHGRI